MDHQISVAAASLLQRLVCWSIPSYHTRWSIPGSCNKDYFVGPYQSASKTSLLVLNTLLQRLVCWSIPICYKDYFVGPYQAASLLDTNYLPCQPPHPQCSLTWFAAFDDDNDDDDCFVSLPTHNDDDAMTDMKQGRQL